MSKIVDFLDFCRIWHLRGFGRMENTRRGCADDLHTILGIFKNDPKSRSVNIFFSGWILPQTVLKNTYLPAKAPPSFYEAGFWPVVRA